MIPVLFSPHAVATTGSFSPSGHKPQLVVDSWRKKFSGRVEIVNHGSLHPHQLALGHDQQYVLDVLSGKRTNGFGTIDPKVSNSLQYTSAGVTAACQYVLNEEATVACAPYSGFHHAGWDHGGGYCTFNGLVIAALQSIASRKAENVLILDCDYHYGDGTQDILNRSPNDDTGFIRHWSAGEQYWNKSQANQFLLDLAETLIKYKFVDLVIYQAGADAHINDPLGGFLTYEQLRVRDRLVFESCAERGIPLVWTLAGGYQNPISKVMKIHEGTLLEAMDVYGI